MNKIKVEIMIGFIILVVTFFLSGYFDILEKLADLSQRYEQYELDELLSISIVLVIILLVFSIRRFHELNIKTKDLQNALNEIKTLKGIIPICSYCNEIRDDKGTWNRLEAYIQSRSNAEFSHGICPNCLKGQKEILKL